MSFNEFFVGVDKIQQRYSCVFSWYSCAREFALSKGYSNLFDFLDKECT